jgi:hypothetical protein
MMSIATDKYSHLTPGGEVSTHLTQEEACAILFAYDYGVDNLSQQDQLELDRVLAKLKEEIWP